MRNISTAVVIFLAYFGTPTLFADEPRSKDSPKIELDQAWIAGRVDQWNRLYQKLHLNPELSFQENETAKELADRYRALGFDVTTGVGKTGVVAVLKNGPGKTVMFRTDLDALPVVEMTGLEYASTKRATDPRGVDVGVMHACGHDIHMTCQVALAEYLAEHKDQWKGTILLIGQPAEEIGQGALAMLNDGLLQRFPRPDFALALHIDSTMPVGNVGYRAGYLYASVDSVDIVVRGRGGHGAFPHTTIDPVVQAAHLILDLQTLISRENQPTQPAVITVGSIHGGTKHNIIDDTCKLQLTVRSYDPTVRRKLLDGIARKAKAAAMSAGAEEPEIKISDPTPATQNDSELVARLVPVFQSVIGSQRVVEVQPVMGGEDFSQYGLAGIPIAMFRLGVVPLKTYQEHQEAKQQLPSLHSPKFYPEAKRSLEVGVQVLSAAAIDLLPNQ